VARKPKVLIVEDQVVVGTSLKTVLGEWFDAELVGSLFDAARKLTEHFDAVLLDLLLPDAENIEALRWIRRHYSEVPVVIYTGIEDKNMALAAIREGAADWVYKSKTSVDEVRDRVAFAIEKRRMIDNAFRIGVFSKS
jgi:DNA-binding NarL/FixJ family response regulator